MIESIDHSQLRPLIVENRGVSIFFALLLVLLSWRLWRFTILPLLRPNEPRELPYWIPCKLLSWFGKTRI